MSSPSVPRLRDSVRIEPAPAGDPAARFVLVDRKGRELARLDDEGAFLLLQMDGAATEAEVRAHFAARFERDLAERELRAWIDGLAATSALVSDGRALRALRYLREQGVSYRGPSRERRGGGRDVRGTGPARRDPSSQHSAWFDYAVVLLNEGRLEDALEVFLRISDADPSDLRVAQIVGHLRFLLKNKDLPELDGDRRDVSWEAFDRALRRTLREGVCPRCGEPLAIELGATNRCAACGCSFSTWLVDGRARRRSGPERRRTP